MVVITLSVMIRQGSDHVNKWRHSHELEFPAQLRRNQIIIENTRTVSARAAAAILIYSMPGKKVEGNGAYGTGLTIVTIFGLIFFAVGIYYLIMGIRIVS